MSLLPSNMFQENDLNNRKEQEHESNIRRELKR